METTSIHTLVSATICESFISFGTHKFCLKVVKRFMKTDTDLLLLKGVNKFLPVHSIILEQNG